MAAYRRVYDSGHLQADCREPGSAPEPYARQSSMGYLYSLYCWSVYLRAATCTWCAPVTRRAAATARRSLLRPPSQSQPTFCLPASALSRSGPTSCSSPGQPLGNPTDLSATTCYSATSQRRGTSRRRQVRRRLWTMTAKVVVVIAAAAAGASSGVARICR